eukprot:jgi/Chlat1/2422/Chrsp17S02673
MLSGHSLGVMKGVKLVCSAAAVLLLICAAVDADPVSLYGE